MRSFVSYGPAHACCRGAIWGLEGLPDHGGSGGLAPRVISAAGKIFYRTTPKLHTITYNGLPDRLAGPPSWATRWACRTARNLPDRLPDRGWSVGQ